jgi:hypothetical protein
MRTLCALTPRGYAGPGGGRVGYVESPTEYYGTSRQVCGLWPFAAGTAGASSLGSSRADRLADRTGAGSCRSVVRARRTSFATLLTLGVPRRPNYRRARPAIGDHDAAEGHRTGLG